jgi:phage gp45-like
MDRTDTARLQARLIGIVGVGRLSLVDDAGVQQVAQVVIHPEMVGIEAIIDATPRLSEYGLASCPPAGAEAIILFMGGRRSEGIIVATGHRDSRIKDLKPGEAALYNGLTQEMLLFQEAGGGKINASLEVEETLTAAHVIPADGASGTFATADGKTVTVTHGIITSIV